jgi:hypothetical protein
LGACIAAASLAQLVAPSARADSYPDNVFLPDMFSIDRIPVTCATEIFELDPKLPVAGKNRGDGHIILNPDILDSMPTVLKLFIAERECGRTLAGRDEIKAACWAVRNGKAQGSLNDRGFALLGRLLQQPAEPGWPARPSAAERRALKQCYAE